MDGVARVMEYGWVGERGGVGSMARVLFEYLPSEVGEPVV